MSQLLFLILLGGLALLIPTAYAGKIGAPWAPTRKRAIQAAFKKLDINEADLVVDLGAGDGKVLMQAALRGAHAIGYELSPIMWLVATIRTTRKPKAKVKLRNFYRQSLPDDTTVIFAFLMPENMARMRKYIAAQNIPKLRYIVIYAFGFKEVQPLTIIREHNCAPMYVYTAEDIKTESDNQ